MIDSHCHLTAEAFAADLPAVLLRAREAGTEAIVTIGDTLESSRRALALAEQAAGAPRLYATAGVHPHAADEWDADSEGSLEALCREGNAPGQRGRIVALGEIGLDYHYDFSPRPVQRAAFAAQADLARRLGLPLVLHCRDAYPDFLEILRAAGPGGCGGVVHCFSGDRDQAAELLELGFHLGVDGPVTFPKSKALRELVREIPLDRLLLETDAPYLAPVPCRGKRNEPAWMIHTLECVARERGMPPPALRAATRDNAVRLFRLNLPLETPRESRPRDAAPAPRSLLG